MTTAGDTPAQVLSRVEHAARGLDVQALATVVLARVEQIPDAPRSGRRTLRWSNAGHLPPVLLLTDGSSRLLEADEDLLLGVDLDTPRSDHTTDLPDGSTLLLFTDGLVERRDASLDDGLARLQAAVVDLAELPLDDLCDTLLTRLSDDAGEDDVALIAVRVHPRKTPNDHVSARRAMSGLTSRG